MNCLAHLGINCQCLTCTFKIRFLRPIPEEAKQMFLGLSIQREVRFLGSQKVALALLELGISSPKESA